MLGFVTILNLLIGDLIPIESKEWTIYKHLREILGIVLSTSKKPGISDYLSVIIEEHHAMFLECFNSFTPKYHLLTHYPFIYSKVGSIHDLSSFRYENKHQESKQIARTSNCRKNLLLTIFLKHQLKFAYVLFSYNDSTKVSLNSGPTSNVVMDYIRTKFNITTSLHLKNVAYLNYNTVFYKSNIVIVIGDYTDELPLFAQIMHILNHKNNYYLCLQQLKTICFNDHLQVYEVEKSNVFFVIDVKDIKIKSTYYISKCQNKSVINYF